MSGPDDSDAGTQTGGLSLKAPDPQPPSERYRLGLNWTTPHLEWRLAMTAPKLFEDQPAFLKLDDPLGAVNRMERYVYAGGLLFDMKSPRFDLVDMAFLNAPTDPPKLLPTFAEMKAAQDEAFYKSLGRTPPLIGAPRLTPSTMLPLLPPPPPSQFFKLPDPAAMRGEPSAPKPGSVGDVLKALHGLPFVQEGLNKLNDASKVQLNLLKREWSNAPWRDRITVISFAAPLAATVVGTVLGVDEARHFAFKSLKGVDLPVPFVPGLTLRIDDFGKADPFLLGTKAGDPQPFQIGFKLDVLKAIPQIRKVF
jgi:hypothetical protein